MLLEFSVRYSACYPQSAMETSIRYGPVIHYLLSAIYYLEQIYI